MLTEKQLNSRSSILPIEEIYTDADVNPFTDYDQRRGYQFDYPVRWMQDPSALKRIGIRRLDITPTSHTFDMSLHIFQQPEVDVDTVGDGEWSTVGTLKTIFESDKWEVAQPYWDVYDIDKEAVNSRVIYKTICNITNKDETGTIYYDSDHSIILTGYTDTTDLNVIIRFYSYDSETGIYEIDEQEYRHNSPMQRKRYETRFLNFAFTPENSTEEILKQICTSFNNDILEQAIYTKSTTEQEQGKEKVEVYTPADITKFTMSFDYDYRSGDVDLNCSYICSKGNPILVSFEFDGNTLNDVSDITELFNQPKPKKGIRNSDIFDRENAPHIMTLHNVWNRHRIFVHASFSESRRNIIGTNNDWYDAPSKFFNSPTNTSEFNVWFTTDGTHVILPMYCPFVIELCFLMNYKSVKFT